LSSERLFCVKFTRDS